LSLLLLFLHPFWVVLFPCLKSNSALRRRRRDDGWMDLDGWMRRAAVFEAADFTKRTGGKKKRRKEKRKDTRRNTRWD